MPEETQTTGLPLLVARRVTAQFRRLRDVGDAAQVQVGLSRKFMRFLQDVDAESEFRDELHEVLERLSGSDIAVALHEDSELDGSHPRVAVARLLQTDVVGGDDRAADHSKPTAPQRLGVVLALRLGDRSVSTSGTVALGRSSSCDLVVNDSEASRRHAEVVNEDGQPVLRDLGSTNGTLVNGRVIDAPICLSVGDIITIGASNIEVVLP